MPFLEPRISKNGEKYVASEANDTILDNLYHYPRNKETKKTARFRRAVFLLNIFPVSFISFYFFKKVHIQYIKNVE